MPDLGSPLTLASTALGVVKGVGDWFGANSEIKKAEEERSRLKQPFYKIQDEYFQNRDIAGNLAGQGLTDSAKNYLTTESQRGFGSAVGATQQAGGVGGNDAGKLLDVYLKSIDKTAAEDAQMKIGNIQNFMNVNKELAGQKTMKWTLDEYQPYQRKLKEITERINAAKQNKNNALNTAIGSLGAGGTALSNSSLMSDLFSNGNGADALPRVDQANPSLITPESVRQPSLLQIPQ